MKQNIKCKYRYIELKSIESAFILVDDDDEQRVKLKGWKKKSLIK